jgi:hypothetical protein
MRLVPSSPKSNFHFRVPSRLNAMACLLALPVLGISTSCGGGHSSPGGPPPLSGNTTVTLLLSSTANSQVLNYGMYIQSLTLNSKSGKTATLISTEQPTEFMHLNGLIEPYGTSTVSQDVYTSATAKIGGASFTCVTVQGPSDPTPGSLTMSTYAYGYVPDSAVTVNLPSPITVTGDTMALKLDLQVAQSATIPNSCYTTQFPAPYAITPNFNLSAIPIVTRPLSSANGRVEGMVGEIQSIATSGNRFALYVSESPLVRLTPANHSLRTATISVDSKTAFYGIADFAGLQAGSFVDLDGAVQGDGSLVASRISVHDPTALNVMFGPAAEIGATGSTFWSFSLGSQGVDYDTNPFSLGIYKYSPTTMFQTTEQFTNLGSLPFVPNFQGSKLVPGQNLAIYSQNVHFSAPDQYTPATTMTLQPQTINGTIVGSLANGLNGYLVQLAPYDWFPILAVQPGQPNLLAHPDLVEVYTDSSTSMLNTKPLTSGRTGRFYGLIFNDNGSLKMDCAQARDGVDITPVAVAASPANFASSLLSAKLPKVTFHQSPDGKRQFYTYTK